MQSKNKVSVVIITGNEEKNIKDCLESVKWADEIIIIDSESSDKTVEIGKQYKVYKTNSLREGEACPNNINWTPLNVFKEP